MEENLQHLLSKHGILASFSIARKMDEDGIKELTQRIKSKCKNKFDFNEKLKSEIQKQSIHDIIENKIPGLINNSPDLEKPISKSPTDNQKNLIYDTSKEKMSLLYILVSKINREIINNNLTKSDICFMIYAILNFFNIKEDDFKNFRDNLKEPDDVDINPTRDDGDDGDDGDDDYDDGYNKEDRDE